MFAVIQTGGKQYKVASSDKVFVERLAGEPGETVTLDVVAVGDETSVAIGAPLVSGAKVTAEILSHGLGDKVLVFKKKRRQNYRRTRGHRQGYTALFVKEIVDANGKKVTADVQPKVKKAPAEKPAEKVTEAKPTAKKAPVKKTAPKAEKAEAKLATEKKAAAPKKAAAKKTETEAKE